MSLVSDQLNPEWLFLLGKSLMERQLQSWVYSLTALRLDVGPGRLGIYSAQSQCLFATSEHLMIASYVDSGKKAPMVTC